MSTPPLRPYVVVCSPLREAPGDLPGCNVSFVRTLCRRIALETGAMPMAPHLMFPDFLSDESEAERALALSYSPAFMRPAVRVVMVLPPWRTELSDGMEHERAVARQLGKEVHWFYGDRAEDRCVEFLAGLYPREERGRAYPAAAR